MAKITKKLATVSIPRAKEKKKTMYESETFGLAILGNLETV